MVNIIEKKNHLLQSYFDKKVKFDVPERSAEDHVPTEVSFVPQLPDQDARKKTKNKY